MKDEKAEGRNKRAADSAWGQFVGPYGEVLSVVALVGAAASLMLDQSMLVRGTLCLLLLGVAYYLFSAAVRYLQRGQEEQEQLSGAIRYRISARRLSTLRKADVPEDVIEALEKLLSHPPCSEQQLLSSLVYDLDLGWERTNEFKANILKYTKVDEPPTTPPAAPAPKAEASPREPSAPPADNVRGALSAT